jgi:hypothetical protein
MSTATHPPHADAGWRRQLRDPQVVVALVTAVCLVVQAIVAKNVLDVELDWYSQLAPFWVFVAYMVSGVRDRTSEIAFVAVIIGSSVAVLVLYAL